MDKSVLASNRQGEFQAGYRAHSAALRNLGIDIANWIRTDGLSTSFIPALEMS